jgi:hypothetical protein
MVDAGIERSMRNELQTKRFWVSANRGYDDDLSRQAHDTVRRQGKKQSDAAMCAAEPDPCRTPHTTSQN